MTEFKWFAFDEVVGIGYPGCDGGCCCRVDEYTSERERERMGEKILCSWSVMAISPSTLSMTN